jgi:manganese/zinc/iron transport system substrate-binding protein
MHTLQAFWLRLGSPLASLFSLVWLAACLGCGSGSAAPSVSATATFQGQLPLKAIATTGMVADIVRAVGGAEVEVTQLMGAGVDPHLYKPTRDDVQTILSGDIVFYSGLMLEGKLADTLVKIARDKPVVAVTERLKESQLLEPEDFAGHYDPHVWMDIPAWSECVVVVAAELARFDPPRATLYAERSAAYRLELETLHAYGQRVMATIPQSRRILITSHDAFNYFGRAYGLEVLGVQGLSTESESGLQRVNELVDLIVAKQVPAVFVESSVPRKNIEALVEGASSRGHEVRIGAELYSDAMGEAGTYEGTYIGMLDHNLTRVAIALGGAAPERGLRGALAAPQENR